MSGQISGFSGCHRPGSVSGPSLGHLLGGTGPGYGLTRHLTDNRARRAVKRGPNMACSPKMTFT